jgi:hypothetical protein
MMPESDAYICHLKKKSSIKAKILHASKKNFTGDFVIFDASQKLILHKCATFKQWDKKPTEKK